MNNTPFQAVYIDSDFLYASLIEEKKSDTDIHCAQQLNSVIHNRNPNIKIFIPFVVIGETINDIKNKIEDPESRAKIFSNLSYLFNEEKIDRKPPTSDVFQIALELIDIDHLLKDTDAMVLSHALCDEYSTHLLTTDTILLKSQSINEKCKTYRKEREFDTLAINSSFQK
jgi:predicted nucleic acid-binding protein